MNPVFVKIITIIVNAFMNIIGTIAIPYIGTSAISMLVLWNLFIVILTVDEHKRTERKQKKLMEKLEHLKDKTSF